MARGKLAWIKVGQADSGGNPMTKGARDLGQFVANTNSIPESFQLALAGGAMVTFVVLLGLNVAPVLVLIPGTLIGSLALYFLLFRIPAFRTSLVVYEHGLESVVQGKSAGFAYDELTAISARFTDHLVNHQYIGTKARIELFVEGRLRPHVHACEFRRGNHGERVVALVIDRCCQEIFKNGDALPFFVMKNDTPNFTPLFGLFQSLCQAIRNIEAAPPRAPALPVA